MADGDRPNESGPRRRRRLRRPRLPRFNLRKAMFVLPNLFTLSSIFCGFYAVVLASDTPGPTQLYQATLAVFFGIMFDMIDGRVARLTKTQSEFGVQIDSLADLVTFGVAPSILVYKWGLHHLGLLGAFCSFSFLACGAIRLARFNVMAARAGGGSSDHFTGLPIPLAAGVLVSLVMFHQRTYAAPLVHVRQVLVLIFVLAYLMVSNVRYRSFKKVKPSPRVLLSLLALAAAFATLALSVSPPFALFVFFCGYVLLGLLEEVIFFRRRRRESRESPKTHPADPPS